MSSIEPLLAEYFLAEVLGESSALAALVGTRIAPAVDGFEPSEFLSEGQDAAEAWPFVLFGPTADALQEIYAGEATLGSCEYLVRCFMREDFAPAGVDWMELAAAVVPALQEAVVLAQPATVTVTDTTGRDITGQVHGLILQPTTHRAVYGERGQRVCEMGIFALAVFN